MRGELEMEEKVISKDYPYNLLIAARGLRMLELPPLLTRDVQAGIAYALSTLEETERNALDQKYRLGVSLCDEQQEIERKALKKLTRSCRWDYIRYGIAGCVKKKVEEAKRKGFIQGYQEGYTVGMNAYDTFCKAPEIPSAIDLPIETMPLSSRACNALRRSGCRTVRDVAIQNITTIRRMRNLGEKGIKEVVVALHSYGLTYTEWELF